MRDIPCVPSFHLAVGAQGPGRFRPSAAQLRHRPVFRVIGCGWVRVKGVTTQPEPETVTGPGTELAIGRAAGLARAA